MSQNNNLLLVETYLYTEGLSAFPSLARYRSDHCHAIRDRVENIVALIYNDKSQQPGGDKCNRAESSIDE
ncbi:hypothetical protein KSZ_72900 [Dictyobacter formicarum]|uniref:Uncharacterized protein n=1 Tax=Dictyobacter formicarum TaxID=2778368 RepID=A0ABQ3VUB5_9CHLR|nr:hypothetical protein KSZ_72900 [Dictyobacter formicarum]